MSRTSLPRYFEPARRRRPIVVMALLAGLAMAGPAARAGAETLTFDTLPAGTLLTEQGGVSFGNGGLIVEAHAQARSSPNVAIPPLDGEFQRKKVFLVFDEAQTFVSIAVQATPAEYGRAYAVTLRGDDGTTLHTIDTATITFVADSNWRVLTVRNVAGTYPLRRAVLSGGQTDVEEPTNFFVIDDLEYSTAPPPPPPDTMSPSLWILRPGAGQAFDGSVIPVTVFARDDRRLRSVRGSITHLDTGHVAGRMDFCGSATSGACPATAPVDETASVSLDPAADGGLRGGRDRLRHVVELRRRERPLQCHPASAPAGGLGGAGRGQPGDPVAAVLHRPPGHGPRRGLARTHGRGAGHRRPLLSPGRRRSPTPATTARMAVTLHLSRRDGSSSPGPSGRTAA